MVIKKWKNIKDCWMKNNKKVETETKSGSGTKKTKKYIYNDQLQFLKKNMPIENTSSTLTNSDTAQQTTNTTTVASTSDAFATPTPVSSQTAAKKKKKDDPDKALIELLSQREDRHLSFFRGILPSLQNFDEAKTRKFQIAVLQIFDNLDNNLPALSSHQYTSYNYNQENNSNNYCGYRTSSSYQSNPESNTQSPQNLPSVSSLNTNLSNLSDDVYFE